MSIENYSFVTNVIDWSKHPEWLFADSSDYEKYRPVIELLLALRKSPYKEDRELAHRIELGFHDDTVSLCATLKSAGKLLLHYCSNRDESNLTRVEEA